MKRLLFSEKLNRTYDESEEEKLIADEKEYDEKQAKILQSKHEKESRIAEVEKAFADATDMYKKAYKLYEKLTEDYKGEWVTIKNIPRYRSPFDWFNFWF